MNTKESIDWASLPFGYLKPTITFAHLSSMESGAKLRFLIPKW